MVLSPAFGLWLRSDAPLPGLAAADAAPADARVVRVHLHLPEPPAYDARDAGERWPPPPAPPVVERGVEPTLLAGGAIRLRYEDGATFVIARDGATVWCDWPPPLTLEDAASYLLGNVMGLLLRAHGLAALHASVTELDAGGERGEDAGAIAVIGPAGAGKSTTAAALARRGLAVLTDDVAALERRDGAWVAHPGFARVRVWPDSAAALFGHADALPALSPTWDKRFLALGERGTRHRATPRRLVAVYVLHGRETADAPRLAPASPRDALLDLVGNAYANHLLDVEMQRRELAALGALARVVPLRHVVPHADVARIDALVELLVADATALVAGGTRA